MSYLNCTRSNLLLATPPPPCSSPGTSTPAFLNISSYFLIFRFSASVFLSSASLSRRLRRLGGSGALKIQAIPALVHATHGSVRSHLIFRSLQRAQEYFWRPVAGSMVADDMILEVDLRGGCESDFVLYVVAFLTESTVRSNLISSGTSFQNK